MAMERSSGGLVKQCAACILLFLHALCGQANDNVIHYEVLYSGDTVRWEAQAGRFVRAVFTEEMPRYLYQLKIREDMDFPVLSDTKPKWPMIEYVYHTVTAHSILNNFFLQLLTYEERQAVLKSKKREYVWVTCMVDANGRVGIIPYFTITSNLYHAGYFKGERLYELARHIKNNVQFPLPPASMVFGGMRVEAGIMHGTHYKMRLSGVLYHSISGYDL